MPHGPEAMMVPVCKHSRALEVVLSGPQRVEAKLVHELSHVARSEERLAQPLVGIAPLVGWRAVEADMVEFDLPDIEDMEFSDHSDAP
jgi:hypothetical protein